LQGRQLHEVSKARRRERKKEKKRLTAVQKYKITKFYMGSRFDMRPSNAI
jgi:hypothetical protein